MKRAYSGVTTGGERRPLPRTYESAIMTDHRSIAFGFAAPHAAPIPYLERIRSKSPKAQQLIDCINAGSPCT